MYTSNAHADATTLYAHAHAAALHAHAHATTLHAYEQSMCIVRRRVSPLLNVFVLHSRYSDLDWEVMVEDSVHLVVAKVVFLAEEVLARTGKFIDRCPFLLLRNLRCSGGLGGGFGGICGVPIGFGVTTTVGGVDPYTDDLYGGGLGYGSTLGYGAAGVPPPGVGGVGGAFNRALNRGPYRRPF